MERGNVIHKFADHNDLQQARQQTLSHYSLQKCHSDLVGERRFCYCLRITGPLTNQDMIMIILQQGYHDNLPTTCLYAFLDPLIHIKFCNTCKINKIINTVKSSGVNNTKGLGLGPTDFTWGPFIFKLKMAPQFHSYESDGQDLQLPRKVCKIPQYQILNTDFFKSIMNMLYYYKDNNSFLYDKIIAYEPFNVESDLIKQCRTGQNKGKSSSTF